MEINTPPKINEQYFINKRQVDEVIEKPATNKPDDENNGVIIRPYIPVAVCDNLILQTVYLSKCINTFAEDMVLNDFNIQSEKDYTSIIDFWELNQDELCNQVKDYLSYGFGGAEIVYDTSNNVAEILQIPADTLHIRKETKNDDNGEPNTYFYAVQQVAGKEDVKMRLSHLTYPKSDDELTECFWIGGGRRSDFYDYPCWLECFNHVSASVSLDLLDAQKLADGNLISGVLVITRPPVSPLNDDDLDATLEEKMENHGSGVFTLELTTLNPDIPLNVQYVQISESNYTYLKELADKSDSKILATFKMPKARLLIDDTTESMNSNKTNTLYKIYSIELNNAQRPLEKNIRKFNNKYFECADKVEIVTPVFVDDKDVESQTTINLFDKGLITLGQAVEKILSIYPEFNNEEAVIDYDNPVYNERYYNGNPLGLTEPTEDESMIYNIGDYIDNAKIEEVFSR